jgi:serine protease Do
MRTPPPIVTFPLATALIALLALALRSHHDAPAVAPLPPNAQALADLTQIDFMALRTPPTDPLRLVRGAAASVSERGIWVTEASVVTGCRAPMIMATPRRGLPARIVRGDVEGVAVLTTAVGAPPLPLGDHALNRTERAFTPGFPRQQPGELTAKKLSDGSGPQHTDVYAETGRTDGMGDSVGSGLMSLAGAPVLDEAGRLVGVAVREAPRRGVILARPLAAVRHAMAAARAPLQTSAESRPVTVDNYGIVADSLRLSGAVSAVVCTDPQVWPISVLREIGR